MAALQSLRTALSALRRNPVLFLGGLLYGVVVTPQSALQLARIPLLPTVLQVATFFVTPFLIAGIIGMAGEGLDRSTSLGTLAAVGRERYVPLFLAKLVEVAIVFVFGILFVVVGIAVVLGAGTSAFAGGGFDPGALSTGVVALGVIVAGVLILFYTVVAFLIQFYPVAIADDGADTIEGFRRSYGVVRANLLSTLGYTLIRVVVATAMSLPLTAVVVLGLLGRTGVGRPAFGGTDGLAGVAPLSGPEVVAVVLISLATTMVLMAFQQTYAVAFYRRHAGASSASSEA